MNAQYSNLSAIIGVDNHSSKKVVASMRFIADGKEIGNYANLKAGDAPVPVSLDVKGINNLTVSFEMDSIENGISLDFINAYLFESNSS